MVGQPVEFKTIPGGRPEAFIVTGPNGSVVGNPHFGQPAAPLLPRQHNQAEVLA